MSEFLRHTTGPRDRWDLLADTYYGDPLRYGPLLGANPDVGQPPILPEGITIWVPILGEPVTGTAGLPPWRL